MKLWNKDKDIKSYCRIQTEVSCSEIRIRKTVEKSKKAFLESEGEGWLSQAGFLYQQSRYIQKRWWIIQGVVLLALWWILNITHSSYYIQKSMGIAGPLFVVLIMPELWKNQNANAMEVECAALYSLRQIYTARIFLFALADVFLLSLFFIGAFLTAGLSAWDFMIHFFLPFNVTCCICFRTLYSKNSHSEVFALLLSMVWTGIWVQLVLNETIYSVISGPAWGIMLFISLLYLGYSLKKGQKKYEEIWEGKPIWN